MAEQFETPKVATRPVFYIAAGIVAALITALGVLSVSFPEAISKGAPEIAVFPAPSVRTDERAQRLSLEKAQRDRLSGKNGGLPIEQAMQTIVARGVHAYDSVTEKVP